MQKSLQYPNFKGESIVTIDAIDASAYGANFQACALKIKTEPI